MKDKIVLFILMPFMSLVLSVLFSSFVDVLVISMSNSNEEPILKQKKVSYRNCYIFCHKNDRFVTVGEYSYLIQSIYKGGKKREIGIIDKLLFPLFQDKNDELTLLTSKIGNTQLIYPKFPFRLVIVNLFMLIVMYFMIIYLLFVIYPVFLDSEKATEKQSKKSNIIKFLKVLIFSIRHSPQIIFVFFSSACFAYNADQVITSIKLEKYGRLVTYDPIDEYKNDIFSRTLQRVLFEDEVLFIPKPYQSIFLKNDSNQAYFCKSCNKVSVVPKLNLAQKYIPLAVTFIVYILSILLLRKTVPKVIYYPKLTK